MKFFNEGRRAYYQAKKRELARKKQSDRVISQDAKFIKHYGMSAYLTLFPEAKDFGLGWHESIILELERMERRQLAQLLSGFYAASGATKNKKVFRRFKSMITSLTSK